MNSFYLLAPDKIATARLTFQQLKIISPDTGNRFFESFGPGMPIYQISQPYERFHDYEQLLNIIYSDDPIKYRKLHKGTPFFFLGWAAFDMQNYTKAVYYLDNAISEDMRSFPDKWEGTEGTNALKLFLNEHSPVYRVIKDLREVLEVEIKRYNTDTKNTLAINSFIQKFVTSLLKIKKNKSARSIVTALYTFVFEFQDRYKEVKLRSGSGGSIEPVLIHLFKGGLLFESLLKQLYPNQSNGKPTETLGDIFKTANFKNAFLQTVNQRSFALRSILEDIKSNDMQTAFNTASRIRNTTGHNLVWDDIFGKPEDYKKLYDQTMNAIFFIITKKYS